VLNNWCSDLGKAGYSAVLALWVENEVLFGSSEEHAEYVETSLKDMCFVYKDPDVPVSIGVLAADN
jgi:hypothetical protein